MTGPQPIAELLALSRLEVRGRMPLEPMTPVSSTRAVARQRSDCLDDDACWIARDNVQLMRPRKRSRLAVGPLALPEEQIVNVSRSAHDAHGKIWTAPRSCGKRFRPS